MILQLQIFNFTTHSILIKGDFVLFQHSSLGVRPVGNIALIFRTIQLLMVMSCKTVWHILHAYQLTHNFLHMTTLDCAKPFSCRSFLNSAFELLLRVWATSRDLKVFIWKYTCYFMYLLLNFSSYAAQSKLLFCSIYCNIKEIIHL